MYSFPYLETVHCSMSGSHCCLLTCIKVSQEVAGKVGWYSHLFKNCPQFVVIHTVKCFSIVNEAEVSLYIVTSLYSAKEYREVIESKKEQIWGACTSPGFPGGSDSKESTCNAGDQGLIPGLESSPGGGHDNPPQYSGLENPHGQTQPMGSQRVGHNCANTHSHTS